MVASKEGKAITEVVIQEGIPTIEKIDGKVAEPLMYLIGGKVVACNYRINTEKSDRVNLNSKGMGFAKVGVNELCSVNSLMARLAVLGAQYEQYK
jgi:glutamate--cysteine ligase